MRREFSLPPEDAAFLNSRGFTWETVRCGAVNWLLIQNFPVPTGYNHQTVTVAVRIEPSYPPGNLDMAYFHPPLSRVDGKGINQTQHKEAVDGREFQRWSRHYTWHPNEDSLVTHILRVEGWLREEFDKR